MGSQCMIRAVLLLMVIQLHCETLLAALQSPVSKTKHKKHSNDAADVDSLERYSNPITSPYVITVPRKPQTSSNSHKRQLHSNDVSDLDNSGQYEDSLSLSLPVSKEKHKEYSDNAADLNILRRHADPSPYIITAPNRKPQTLSKSRRRQVHSDDAADLNSLRRNADPSPYIITAPNRKPQTPSKSRRRQIHSDDAAGPDSSGLYANPISSPYVITVPNCKPQTSPSEHQVHSDDAANLDSSGLYADHIPSRYIIRVPNHKPHIPPSDSHRHQVHSVDATNLDNLRRYIITAPERTSAKPKPKRRMYSDVPDEYLNDVPEEYSDDAPDQYSDAMLSSTYLDSAQPARRSNTLLKLTNVGIKGLSAIPKILLGDDDEKPKRSHHEEVETIIKCPQGTELVGDHCKVIPNHLDNSKGIEIKKIVTKSDVYMDDY